MIVIVAQIWGKYLIIRYLDPWSFSLLQRLGVGDTASFSVCVGFEGFGVVFYSALLRNYQHTRQLNS